MWNRQETVAVVDFETTGSGPTARATEIGLVLLRGGQEVERFASLMRSDTPVPPFIERLTGISNAMLAKAPWAETVMRQVAALCADCSLLVAHNAAFDAAFWRAEMARVGQQEVPPFACTVRLARRVYPQAPNHKLGTMVATLGLKTQGRAHRALADALVTAQLWQRLGETIAHEWASELAGMPLEGALLAQLQAQPRAQWPGAIRRARRVCLAPSLPLSLSSATPEEQSGA